MDGVATSMSPDLEQTQCILLIRERQRRELISGCIAEACIKSDSEAASIDAKSRYCAPKICDSYFYRKMLQLSQNGLRFCQMRKFALFTASKLTLLDNQVPRRNALSRYLQTQFYPFLTSCIPSKTWKVY